MSKSSGNPTGRKAGERPEKPYEGFPLTPHAGGKWMKKIRGTIHYFGRWGRIVKGKMERLPGDGWQEALAIYKAQAEDLHAGRTPRPKIDGLTVGDLRERFLTAKSRALDAGEITARTYAEYRQSADRLQAMFGEHRLVDDLAADDFEHLRADMASHFGPVRLSNEVQRVRTIFKWGYDAALIKTPMRFGPDFKKPSAAVLRKHRAKNGEKMLEAEQIRLILDALDGKEVVTGTDETGEPVKVKLEPHPALRAMILLGVNCGFIAKDCADLPLSALDLKGEWIDFPRPKTGIARRCALWPETVDALKAAIEARPEPETKEAKRLVFVTTRGRPWIIRGTANRISFLARDLMMTLGVHRSKGGFATLRHVFRTIADGAKDQVAVNHAMGHSDSTMAGVYRERIDDSRLRAVADHVRAWLWPQEGEGND